MYSPKRATGTFEQQSIGDELLLYNNDTHMAYSLNGTAARVWQACDGTRGVADLATLFAAEHEAGFAAELVELTVDDLERDGLLTPRAVAAPMISAQAIDRRLLLGRMGASAAVLLPAIAMLMTPTAAQAYSGCVDC